MVRVDEGTPLSARERALSVGMPPEAFLLVIDANAQHMNVLGPRGEPFATYPVSTSRFGLGEQCNSFRTPRGVHEVAERYGDGLPAGAVLVSRSFTGEVVPATAWRETTDEDKILTRILRLAGREPGLNLGDELDSYARMIYIHGTNHEQDVGVAPSSRGCIRMRNHDLVALFELLKTSTVWVVIEGEKCI